MPSARARRSIGRAPSAWFSPASHARAFSSEATIESSERNRRTKRAPSSHSLRAGSSRYFSANRREAVGSLTPSVAATRDWLSSSALAARTTALVSTSRRSGAGRGVVFGAWSFAIPWKLYRSFLSKESDRLDQLRLARAWKQRGGDRIGAQLRELGAGEAERRRACEIVVERVAAEVGRIVGVHRHAEARVEQPLQVVLFEAPEHLQLHVRQRAHRERHALRAQARDQRRLLLAAHAMVDAHHLQEIERLLDVLGRALLAGVGEGHQALAAGPLEHALEFRRRMALLRGIEPDSVEEMPEGQCLVEGRQRVGLGQVPQEADDEPRAQAERCFAFLERRLHRHAARGVGLRVAEDFRVHHAVGVRLLQVGRGERMEVFGLAQHRRTLVVDVEEGLQIVELVRFAQFLDRGITQRRLVSSREGKKQLRLEAALDVQMQLRFRQAADELVEVHAVARSPAHLPGTFPSTPSTYQLTESISLSLSVLPAGTRVVPSLPLIGPLK